MYPALSRSHTVVVIHICRAHNKFHVFYSINIILRVFKVRSVEAKLFNLKSSICSGYVSLPFPKINTTALSAYRGGVTLLPLSDNTCNSVFLPLCPAEVPHLRSVTAVRLFESGVLKIHNCHVFHPSCANGCLVIFSSGIILEYLRISGRKIFPGYLLIYVSGPDFFQVSRKNCRCELTWIHWPFQPPHDPAHRPRYTEVYLKFPETRWMSDFPLSPDAIHGPPPMI